MKPKNNIIAITIVIALVLISLSLVIGFIFFGIVGFFNIFEVEYTSFSSLLGFLVLFLIIGGLMDLISIGLIAWAAKCISGKHTFFLLKMLINCTFTWIALHVVDELMASITIPLITEIIAAIMIFIIEIAFKDKTEVKIKVQRAK